MTRFSFHFAEAFPTIQLRLACAACLFLAWGGATAEPSALAARQNSAPASAQTGAPSAAATSATATAAPGTPVITAASHTAPITLQQQIAKLAPLTGTGIDASAQGKRILTHLNSVLHFYRTATTSLQKVGEPSDVIYADQARTQATQIAQLAFQSARNEIAILARIPGANTSSTTGSGLDSNSQTARLLAARTRIAGQIAALEAQDVALTTQLAKAAARTRPELKQQQEQVEGGLELQRATLDAITRISAFSDAQTQTGLAGDIDRLQNSAPELTTTNNTKPLPAPTLESLADARNSGVTSQASALFQLLGTRHSIDAQIGDVDTLSQQAAELRTPFLNILKATVARGQQLTQQGVDLQATTTTDAQDLAATRKQFSDLTLQFHVLADAMLPLSQQIVLLETERSTLTAWRIAVDSEYKSLLRSLLVRVASIAFALGVLWLLSTLWNRATIKYVGDLRRRRQLLLIRRIVVGFVGGLIVIFGFVTQFSSLATFAGFITAGIAVGLQTILLSVAAYFFIIGRYGVKVGDRITVAGVTGDVIEVGLVRFYLTELVGTGTELHSTGRVAVFANSVLFQTGTPLYKQMPGTEYAWHELLAKLNPGADVDAVKSALLAIVENVYGSYKEAIEQQHAQVEEWLGAAVDKPGISSQLQLVDGTLTLAVLFPVEIAHAAETDQQIAKALMPQLLDEGPLKQGLAATPSIKAAIKS